MDSATELRAGQLEVVARALARQANGLMCDTNTVVEMGEPARYNGPEGALYNPRPFSAPLWVFFKRQAQAAIDAALQPSPTGGAE